MRVLSGRIVLYGSVRGAGCIGLHKSLGAF